MVFRVIGLIVLGLVLSSCLDGGLAEPRREHSGVWLYEFEGSSFVEGATEAPARRPAYEDTDWLEWYDWGPAAALMDPNLSNVDCYTVQPFRVTFVGRRSRYPFGGVGHMSVWRSKVKVDRMISIERLGPSFCYE